MPRGHGCHRRGCARRGACSCELGNLYRFAEPVILLALARLGEAHGYQLAQEAQGLAVTDADLDSAVIYRTLRRLEEYGYARSTWDTTGTGPARRIYSLTAEGREHLQEWSALLEQLVGSLSRLAASCRQASAQAPESGQRLPL